MCQVVNERTTGALHELAVYGVTQAMLDEQQAAIDAYFADLVKPHEGVISRKNATASILEEFRKGDEILTLRLDKLAGMLMTSNPEVYKSYMNARIILDLGHRKKNGEYKIEGETIDFESGLPLSGVNVSIMGTNSVVMTGPDGRFSIPVKNAGDYSLRAKKDGYKVLIDEEVIVGNGQEEVVMEMEKA